MQNCSNSIANALELLQSCTKPSICFAWMWLTLPQRPPTNGFGCQLTMALRPQVDWFPPMGKALCLYSLTLYGSIKSTKKTPTLSPWLYSGYTVLCTCFAHNFVYLWFRIGQFYPYPSLALKQSYGYPSVSEVALKNYNITHKLVIKLLQNKSRLKTCSYVLWYIISLSCCILFINPS